MREYKISREEDNVRLDKFVRKVLNDAPLSMIYKLFRKKDIKVNGKSANDKTSLHEGDVVRIYLVEAKYEDVASKKKINLVDYHFKVVFEDENILIVSKPIGINVIDSSDKNEVTLTDEVKSYLIKKGEYNPLEHLGFAPSPAHRIDRNTSGIVVFSKNMESLQILNDIFKNRKGITKTYLALVNGSIDKEGTINKPLLKDGNSKLVKVSKDGKTAITNYKPVVYNQKYSLIEVEILTGRTHQIRVHMSSIGHPLVGDKKYGDFKGNSYFERIYKWKYQFLHAYKISFNNIINRKLSYLNGLEFIDELDGEKKRIVDKIF